MENLDILEQVALQAGCKICSHKSLFYVFGIPAHRPIFGRYNCQRTLRQDFVVRKWEVTHIYSAAYVEKEFDEILKLCDHISFNSFSQWRNIEIGR